MSKFQTVSEYEKMGLKELVSLCDTLGLDSSECESKVDIIQLLTKETEKQQDRDIEAEKLGTPPERPVPPVPLPLSAPSISNETIQTIQNPKINGGDSFQLDKELSKNFIMENVVRAKYRFVITNTVPVNSASEKIFTAYLVEILDENNDVRTALKRYRQFADLHEQIKRHYPKRILPKMTKKKLIGNMDPDFIYKRCKKLESYLNEVAKLPGIFDLSFMTEFVNQADFDPRGVKKRHSESGSSEYLPLERNLSFKQPSALLNERIQAKILQMIEKDLDVLNFSSMDIKAVPEALLNQHWTPKLKGLNLSSNQLTKFPKEYGKLVGLEKLDLSNNMVKDLEGLEGLSSLLFLNLSRNPLSLPPQSLMTCKSLTILDMSGCSLMALPEDLIVLTNLVELNLFNNNIQDLPTEMGNLSKLSKLNVADNLLKDLPLSMGKCKRLSDPSSVLLDGNPITEDNLLDSYQRGQLAQYLEKRMNVGHPITLNDEKITTLSQPELLPFRNGSFIKRGEDTPVRPLEDKIVVIKKWALNEIDKEILTHLTNVKQQMQNAESISSAKPIAQQLRDLKEIVEEASRHNYWIRVKQVINKLEEHTKPPPMPTEDDKLQSLKRIVLVVIHDLQIILSGIRQVLDTSTLPQEIIQLVKIIKELQEKFRSSSVV